MAEVAGIGVREFTTPMMKQYISIKKQYHDCLLFFRLGDFYELFMEDALVGAKVLDITLTSRPKGRDGRIPMAGVPYHAVDAYLYKLVKAGYKVAICEQVSEPDKKAIVEREVVRVVTPGTILDEKSLNKKDNNFLIALIVEGKTLGITATDLSTGYMETREYVYTNLHSAIVEECMRLNPVECIVRKRDYENKEILKSLKSKRDLNIFCFNEWDEFEAQAKKVLKKQFEVSTLSGFGIDDKPLCLASAAALLSYLEYTQKHPVSHIKKIQFVHPFSHVVLDRSTIVNLELFSTMRDGQSHGSLLSTIDYTLTAMGGRLLKQWIKKPLTTVSDINSRLDAVAELCKKNTIRMGVQNVLREIPDVERLLSRLSVGIGSPRDLVSLSHAISKVLIIKKLTKKLTSPLFLKLNKQIVPTVETALKLIEDSILPEPSFDPKDGKVIKNGISKELDRLRAVVGGSQTWMERFEAGERTRTGISSLKVRFNKVFGFYIEITKVHLASVPSDYMRKQTLVNNERFITPELKKHEEIILSAEEKIAEIEYELYLKVLKQVLEHTRPLQEGAGVVSVIDCLVGFATAALKLNYVRPTLINSGELHLFGSRHPVVEQTLDDTRFVPNDIHLDNARAPVLLLTGPNMAGKSVLIRQVALTVLMAHIGCFVPATKAQISLVDRIFVRSGASDMISHGLSTFMVEMVEAAHILHYATKKSLVIMDEIGRGTSTYDGISIARAIVEYMVTYFKIPPKTLFATHYHELQTLEKEYPKKIKNYHMAVVQEKHHSPVFLYTLKYGGASHSFGIAVAQMAGVPSEVVSRATAILHELEKPGRSSEPAYSSSEQSVISQLKNIDINALTPLSALNTLSKIQKELTE